MLKNEDIKHIIFDFDNTLSFYHLHNECVEIMSKFPQKFSHRSALRLDQLEIWDSEAINFLWQQLSTQNKLKTTGSVKEWQIIFITLINNDYHVSIASFSSFKPIIELFLKEIVCLPDEYLNKITIEAWLPQDQTNKNAHIDRIIGEFSPETDIDFSTQLMDTEKRKEFYKQIFLIDDVSKNTNIITDLVGPNHALTVQPKNITTPLLIIRSLENLLKIEFFVSS